MATADLLVLGIGNDSRGDDGLGWALVDRLKPLTAGRLALEHRYQLAPEDAELLTRFSSVLFVDASQEALPDGFTLLRCPADSQAGLYTHQQTPGAILFLAKELYGHQPEAFLLSIQGFDWGLGDGLSAPAQLNLERAYAGFRAFFEDLI